MRVGGPRRGGVRAGRVGGGGESGRATTSGTEMHVGEEGRQHGRARQRRETALHACRGAEEKRGTSVKGAARRGGGDDDGGREAIWGESADLEGDGAYIEPPPFVMGRITNHDKRPFSLGS
jgi:hypothetical protein